VPGIEYDVQPTITYWVTAARRSDTDDPQKRRRHPPGGRLAVLAHPGGANLTDNPQLAAAVDGVEVWNTMHDGAYLPNPTVPRQLRRLRRRAPENWRCTATTFISAAISKCRSRPGMGRRGIDLAGGRAHLRPDATACPITGSGLRRRDEIV
jgi:hypothetical protein